MLDNPLEWVRYAEEDWHLAVSPDRLLTRRFNFLTDCAVTVRYSSADSTLDEARQAVTVARTVRAFARRWLGLPVQ